MQLRIDNEYDRLEAVLVHRPGKEIERLTHRNMHQFLFEDIPYLRRIQDEHDRFTDKMRDAGVDVVYLESLLQEVLQDAGARRKLIEDVCQTAAVPSIVEDLAGSSYWDAESLTELLFVGLTPEEYQETTGREFSPSQEGAEFLLTPIPNAYFSRDPAVVVRDAAISSKMHFPERIRETQLTRAVLENHPEFASHQIAYGGTDEPTEDRPYTIEGGDVIILSSEAVLIGDSERTRSETIEMLAGKCFHAGQVKRVYEIPIPSDRAFMHLDTIFTIVDRGMVLWYPKVMTTLSHINRYEPSDPGEGYGARRVSEDRDFLTILRDEFDQDVTVVNTGGGSEHFAAREQRTDGANVLAISPKVAITYERNERTVEALRKHGVTCINIEGSELVRGLGGPRCMTMPLRRTLSVCSSVIVLA